MALVRALIAVFLIGAIGLAATWYWRSRPERTIVGAVGTGEICIDDFGFTVVASRSIDSLGPPEQPVLPRGRFVVVSLRVNNHAKRVDYRFEPRIARLVGANGEEYEVSPEAQGALDAARSGIPSHATPLHPGESLTTDLVFDVPLAARGLMFRVSFASGLFDAIDVAMFGNQRLRIE